MTAVPIPNPEPSEAAAAITRPARGHLLAVPDLAGYAELRIWAESYDDAQRARIACANRMERGGVPPELFAKQIDALEAAEHQIKLALGRCYRRVAPPGVRDWQESTFGVGAHLLARLLGALGHPRIATPYHWEGDGPARVLVADEVFERSVRQLWAYCGHGEALRRRKGMTVDEAFGLGSPRCKMLVHLLAEASIKCAAQPMFEPIADDAAAGRTLSPHPAQDAPEGQSSPGGGGDLSPIQPINGAQANEYAAGSDLSSPQSNGVATARSVAVGEKFRYRHTYDQRRAHTAITHPEWTAGHSHNDALRIVGKEILRDLWTVA